MQEKVSQVISEQTIAESNIKKGRPPKRLTYYEGLTKLKKRETARIWNEFGGNRVAHLNDDGTRTVSRVIEHTSCANNINVRHEQKLIRGIDGCGTLSWRVELCRVSGRKPSKKKFDMSWQPSILEGIRAVVINGIPLIAAAKQIAEKLDAPVSTIRANLWVANKWARGEAVTFTPHRSMVGSIIELLCELGKKEQLIKSLTGYCEKAAYPSKYIATRLNELKQAQQ